MLYGCNGYTGELIAAAAAAAGERPILAGRRADAVAAVAGRFGCEHRVFALDDPAAIARELAGVDALVLAAGPFSRTSAVTVEACLRARVHYLDITGEVAVFEAAQRRDAEARAAGVVVLPGVGFDVVPSDCLARSLAEALPGAVSLELAFHSRGGASRGTLKTMVEGAASTLLRREGVLRPIRTGSLKMRVPFRDRPRTAAAITWGDLSTAYWSTGIPSITTYMAVSPGAARALALVGWLRPLVGSPWVVRALQGLVERGAAGPDAEVRARSRALLWGRVRDAAGRERTGSAETPEGYDFTAGAAVECVRRVLRGGCAAGYQSPATAFGAGFLAELPGSALVVDPG